MIDVLQKKCEAKIALDIFGPSKFAIWKDLSVSELFMLILIDGFFANPEPELCFIDDGTVQFWHREETTTSLTV